MARRRIKRMKRKERKAAKQQKATLGKINRNAQPVLALGGAK